MTTQEQFEQVQRCLKEATAGDVRLQKCKVCMYCEEKGLKLEYEIIAYIDNRMYCGRAESIGKAIDALVGDFHNTGEQSDEVIPIIETVHVLFRTDVNKTRRSRVLCGVFSDGCMAIDAAKELGLFTHQSAVEVIECKIDKPGEI
jgi:hypothetical protein